MLKDQIWSVPNLKLGVLCVMNTLTLTLYSYIKVDQVYSQGCSAWSSHHLLVPYLVWLCTMCFMCYLSSLNPTNYVLCSLLQRYRCWGLKRSQFFTARISTQVYILYITTGRKTSILWLTLSLYCVPPQLLKTFKVIFIFAWGSSCRSSITHICRTPDSMLWSKQQYIQKTQFSSADCAHSYLSPRALVKAQTVPPRLTEVQKTPMNKGYSWSAI